MGTSARNTVLILATLASIYAGISRFFGMGGNTGWSSTPQFGRRHGYHPRFRRHVPNGKWVMSVHGHGRGSRR